MEEIINRLLLGDTEVIQQATAELTEAFKNPEAIPALCNLIVSCTNAQVRQYAALLLRKRLAKSKNWLKVPPETRNSIKQGMLSALVSEPEKSVKSAIAQFIGSLVRHEFSQNSWPEVLQFIHTLCMSEIQSEKELGMFTMSVMTDMSPSQYLAHLDAVCILCSGQLDSVDVTDTNALTGYCYYTILTLTSLTPVIEGHQGAITAYSAMLPRVLVMIQALATVDSEKCVKSMEFLDDLVEVVIAVVVPHVRRLVEICLELASNSQVNDNVRVKATSIVGLLVRTKRKVIIKNKLVEPLITVLFTLMGAAPADESSGTEEYFVDDADHANPMTCATQTLDVLALHLPPEKLIPPLLNLIEPALSGNEPFKRKAAYHAMAVIAEGCAESIRGKYLPHLLASIGRGITDPNLVVRNAALFALGQFSEHLQPDISQYASEILPVLFDYLAQICGGVAANPEPSSIDRMFYALEMFCENLEDELSPYLDTLMERLFLALDAKNSVHLRELALSAVGATANAAKEKMLPYFPRLVEGLKTYLTIKPNDEDTLRLQVQAVDTFGVLARTIGEENFMPLALDALNLGLLLVKDNNDPNLRKSVYGLFASLASVIKEEIGPALPTIVELMLESVRSSEGIVPHIKDEDTVLDVYAEDSDQDQDEDIENSEGEDDEDSLVGWSVENDYVEEKEEACLALKEIAEFSGTAFLPFLVNSFEEIFKLMNYPQEDIRKAALDALAQFCVTLSNSPTAEAQLAKMKALSVFVPKCSEIIRTDSELPVVMSALDAYSTILKEIKSDVLAVDGHRDAIFNCIMDVMSHKVECQDGPELGDNSSDGDDEQAEQDELLVECAGDVLPKLGQAMRSEDFLVYFQRVLPLLLASTKKSSTTPQRSFAVGIISESIAPLGLLCGQVAPQLLPLLLQLSRDDSEEVRNNAIYGIGEIVYHGKEHLYPRYTEILSALSTAVSRETHPGTLDNICGALARMLTTNMSAVPIEQVLPVFVQYLPLRQDFEENFSVYECLQTVFSTKHPTAIEQIGPILNASAKTLLKKQWSNDDTMNLIVSFTRALKHEFPEQYNAALPSLSPELISVVQQL